MCIAISLCIELHQYRSRIHDSIFLLPRCKLRRDSCAWSITFLPNSELITGTGQCLLAIPNTTTPPCTSSSIYICIDCPRATLSLTNFDHWRWYSAWASAISLERSEPNSSDCLAFHLVTSCLASAITRYFFSTGSELWASRTCSKET